MFRTIMLDHFNPTSGNKFAQEFAALEFAFPVIEVNVVVQQRDSAPICGHFSGSGTKRTVPYVQPRMARFQVDFQFVSISFIRKQNVG